ncbi:alpha/beta hydrolase [Corynebacterium crudilactis]|uniref:BD-FAE-like domain-containing protein n=1 Tax=Corynebacterium crudilactis TaxID=1652495 RepID=A0A172QT53_9CORY|nr:alpha/beta hydrolase [Corynebacterium crudilactis]ANE03872.1 hypothetical protein ccrud_06370 [Corynebacterium crudilactis]
MDKPAGKRHSKKILVRTLSVLVGLVAIAVASFALSPVPGAKVIKTLFDADARNKHDDMQQILGDKNDDVIVHSDISYGTKSSDEKLDIYQPQTTDSSLPVIIWMHGGAWISGDKTDAAPYFKELANRGFVVVSLNYSLAPEQSYPTQIHQLNDAYGYVKNEIADYQGDTSKIILAGDSAGAQMTSQLAAITTNPGYAQEMNIEPQLEKSDITALILYCGIYKIEHLAEPEPTLSKILSWGNRTAVWSLTGTRNNRDSATIHQISAFHHVTSDFPTTFISGGNGDPLTNVQSVPFAEKLESLGTDVTTLFYPEDHTPALPHENQFVLDEDGLAGFEILVDYLKKQTA